MAYVASVGCDFMQGRFLSYAYFVSVILWITQLAHILRPTGKALAGLTLCGYLVLYPHTPFNSPTTYVNQLIHLGIADERGVYFNQLSLIQYVNRDTRIPYFPMSENAVLGRQLKASTGQVTVDSDLGVLGYHAGIDTIIVDPLALSDPLLARMPVRGNWRIGHFPREIPAGYLETLRSGKNAIADPGTREFYEKLRIVTESRPLFTFERLKTILLFNIGAYDDLVSR
jgi:arabinofuranosyltransferase